MGDIIHSMVVLQFIKKQFPNYQIDWIVEEGFKTILENNPHIDTILTINLKSIKKRKSNIFSQIKLIREYAKNNYDLVIDAQGLLKSAIVSKILGGRIVGSKIVGFDNDSIRESVASWLYDEGVSIGYDKNVIERNIKVIGKPLGVSISHQDILEKSPFLYYSQYEENLLSDMVLVVGASKENKIYPKEKFLEIIKAFEEKKIYIIWANEYEKEVAQYLSNQSCAIMCDKMSLDKLKYLISQTKIVIGGDTGPTHISWGLNIPSVAIFGNTPEYRNTYITPINQVVKSESKVDPLKLDYSDFSIKDIDSSLIIEKVKQILGVKDVTSV
jgi:heptosyltransferase-1